MNHAQHCILVSDVADVDGVDLGDGGDGKSNRNARSVSHRRSKLEFIGGTPIFRERHGCDFKPMQKEKMLDVHSINEGCSEGEENSNFLATAAPSKQARINLIVPRLEIMSVLCDEAEGNFTPLSVAPHGSDDKRHESKTAGLQWFDIVEEVIAGITFKIMYG